MWPFDSVPLPPVPASLREMLKDYPGHIERLQETLAEVLIKKSSGVDPFDRVVWALDGQLETFLSEARDEFEAATASGDPQSIAQAGKKRGADVGRITSGDALFKRTGRLLSLG